MYTYTHTYLHIHRKWQPILVFYSGIPTPGDLPNPGTEPVSLALASPTPAGGVLPLHHLESHIHTHIWICLYTPPELLRNLHRTPQRAGKWSLSKSRSVGVQL